MATRNELTDGYGYGQAAIMSFERRGLSRRGDCGRSLCHCGRQQPCKQAYSRVDLLNEVISLKSRGFVKFCTMTQPFQLFLRAFPRYFPLN
jgi:hypothetical protein